MPVASMASPISPPSASISRTRWPLAVPPIAGLQGISATVSADSVTRPTRQPMRAAAHAASHPAWPAPITMTSKSGADTARQPHRAMLLADAEPREDVDQQVVHGAPARDFLERGAGAPEVRQHQFLGDAVGECLRGPGHRLASILNQREMPDVRDERWIAQVLPR